MSITPYMNLTLPTVSVTLGPEYATENNTAFGVIDSHNHTTGQGIQIPTAGINIDADFAINEFNVTNLRSSRYTAQASPLALVTDLNCAYFSGVDFWVNDGNGNQIQLTASGALNAASIGGIGGDYSTSTASVAYSDSTKTFKFLQDTNKSSLLDTGTILLRRTDITSSAAITLKADTSLSVGWTFTLPTAPPASPSFVGMDASGNMTFPYTLTTLTTALSASFITSCVITKFTSSGTWTKATLNPKFVRVTVIGAGGGSGGNAATGGSEGACSGGGGGGGGSIKTIMAASLGATETVTVGAGGTAASTGNNSGGTGGTSSFGSHCQATGGGGGAGSAASSTIAAAAGGAGGVGSGGDLNFNGSYGGIGRVIAGFAVFSGSGGASFMSGTLTNQGLAAAGLAYGGGAAGASSSVSTGTRGGNVGATGVVIVEEYY